MGIQGLLPALKSIITPVHVRTYAGKSAAIDTYSWLHKAAFSCSKELCEGSPTDKLIDYCMHRVNLLRYYGVQPVLVFDGGVLPMKADQELKRARSRKENFERARDHEWEGNPAGAHECYQRAVDITPAQAARLIKVLQQEGVQYVVAPYEADAQMAYLAFNGHVDVIITEDSDLIAYGCPRVFFKMDKSGQGEAFEYADLERNTGLEFRHFTKQMVLEMCVMTGCDYLPSLPGMGVKKAHGLIKKFKSYQKVIRHLRFSGTTISAKYEELFERALLTFHHQRVYDPASQQMVHLTEVPDDVTVDLEFVGPDLPRELVRAIAVGDVDPSTNLPFQEAVTAVHPALPNFGDKFFSNRFVPKKPAELFPQKNRLTNYFLSEYKVTKKQFKAPRKVLSTEKEAENRPAKDRLFFDAPEAGDLASTIEATEASATPLSEVYGTPLPDDDEDSVPGSYETLSELSAHVSPAQDNIPEWESQESLDLQGRIRSRPGVLQDSLESSVSHRVSSESATTAVRLFGKDRMNSIVDAPPIKLSRYFSHLHTLRSKSTKPHNADCPPCKIEIDLKHADSCGKQVTKKHRIDIGRAFFENLEGGLGLQPPVPFEDVVSFATRRSGERSSSSFENLGDQASPITAVPRGCGSSEVGKFAINVSHIDQYVSVAQKSVDKFAQTLEAFRWSSKGARASGLRKPMATISTNTSTRIATTGPPRLGAALEKFAYKPSCFKPPFRNSRSSGTTGAATTGTVRAEENEFEPH